MAEISAPSPSQLSQARDALLPLVRRLPGEGEPASPLWRAAHAALCQVEAMMGLPPTVPPREVRRRGGES